MSELPEVPPAPPGFPYPPMPPSPRRVRMWAIEQAKALCPAATNRTSYDDQIDAVLKAATKLETYVNGKPS